MPGPGRGKGKSSKVSKPKSTRPVEPTPSLVADPFLRDIDNAEGWSNIVTVMCNFYKLPDLTTRSGLKKVHAEFKQYYDLLDAAYRGNLESERILGGVIGIYAKMCVDSILRDKLFKKGLLSKLLPLLDKSSTRHLAMRALSTVTHHGGISARIEIAHQTPVLLRLIESDPTDHRMVELAITTLAHSVGAITNSEKTPPLKDLKAITAQKLLRVVIEVLRTAPPSLYLMDHAMELLASVPRYCPVESKACPSMLNFLVASLRANDVIFRCSALGGLLRLHCLEAEFDRRVPDPMKLRFQVEGGFPEHLQDVMMDYGLGRCDTILTLTTGEEYQNAMMACAQDKDLYVLGLKLAKLILRTEFSVVEGGFQAYDTDSGKPKLMDVGLPFIRWIDSLPHCASAIRQKAKITEQDLADILDLKYFIVKQRIPDAVAFAKKCIDRNPSIPYFYYAMTLSADTCAGLRNAKKGLMCKRITPFVRFQLMRRAVEHAGDMGIRILRESAQGGDEEGNAFLTSALEDARVYVEEAPPDSRHMKGVLYWYCLLTLAMKGPEISENLSELKDKFRKLQVADDFSISLGVPPPKTQLRLTHLLVTKLYSSAIKEWRTVIDNFNSISSSPPVPAPSKAEDDLAAWLDDIDDEHGEAKLHDHGSHPKNSSGSNVELYRCSWCGNPSAVLKKCGGCSKTRYCDPGCQKQHWKDHKGKCKPSISA